MQTIPVRNIKKTHIEANFNILNIKSILNGVDMVQEVHRHNFYFILVLETGGGEHLIDFKQFFLGNNTIFILRPGQVHSLTLKKESKGYIISFQSDFLCIDNTFFNELLRKVSHNNYYKLTAKEFIKRYALVHRIYEEFHNQKEAFQELIKANLEILFIELCRNKVPKTTSKSNLYKQERLEEFLHLLESQIIKYKQVSDYTQLLNLSSYQLNSITKTLLGKTSSMLINEQIILEAKRQLLATSKQVNQIAFYLGYDDASYFIRFFKKHTKYSPESFRKNFK